MVGELCKRSWRGISRNGPRRNLVPFLRNVVKNKLQMEHSGDTAMNKVIYALLRGWLWVLIGPRLSLSLSLSHPLHPFLCLSLSRLLLIPQSALFDPCFPYPCFRHSPKTRLSLSHCPTTEGERDYSSSWSTLVERNTIRGGSRKRIHAPTEN